MDCSNKRQKVWENMKSVNKRRQKELFTAIMQMIMESELPFWSVNQALKEIQGIITYEVGNLPIEKIAEGQKKSRRW